MTDAIIVLIFIVVVIIVSLIITSIIVGIMTIHDKCRLDKRHKK